MLPSLERCNNIFLTDIYIARRAFYSSLISLNICILFRTVSRLTKSHTSVELCIPLALSNNDFMSYLNKSLTIKETICHSHPTTVTDVSSSKTADVCLDYFSPINNELTSIVPSSKLSTCLSQYQKTLHKLIHHADDTQLYLSKKLDENNQLARLKACLDLWFGIAKSRRLHCIYLQHDYKEPWCYFHQDLTFNPHTKSLWPEKMAKSGTSCHKVMPKNQSMHDAELL